jgi:flagellar FliL protein
MADFESAEDDSGKKKSGLIVTIAVVLVLSLVAAGGGWMVGGLIAPQVDQPETAASAGSEAARNAEKEEEAENKPRENVVPLDPITTNLSYPSDSWIRIEVSLVFIDEPGPGARRSDPPGHAVLSAHRIASADRRAARLSVFAR